MSLIQSRIRALGGVVAVATLALAVPAWADQAPAADAMVVVRDAETGQLRAPTAEEAAALSGGKASAVVRSTRSSALFASKRHASGAVGVRSNDDMASFAVVTKLADGTLAAACVESKGEAEQAVQSGVTPAQQAPEK